MRCATRRSIRGFACAALLLAGAVAVQAGGDVDAIVARGKKLIESNAKAISAYAHAPSTYTYKGAEYLGHKKTKDGLHELTFRFTVKGNLKTQKMQMGFFFKDNGKFEFLRVGDSTTLYEPFKKLSASYLKQLRGEMAKRPAVAGNAELLRTVDTNSAQELCEMYLKQQDRPRE